MGPGARSQVLSGKGTGPTLDRLCGPGVYFPEPQFPPPQSGSKRRRPPPPHPGEL